MFNNILIISDNLYLCKRVFDIINNHKIEKKCFNIAISPFSNLEAFNESLNRKVLVYNLKLPEVIEEIIKKYDLVISVHCKQIFPKEMVNNVKCINIHPGYNPINRGWYPQVFSILNDLPIGATIHEIDEQLDNGKIIAREFVKKNNDDTSETLYNRVLEKEIELFEKNIINILSSNYSTLDPEKENNLFLKKDFNELCKLNLNQIDTFANFIKKLRALSHGDFKNAYYIDPKTKEKIYIKIQLTKN